MSMKVRMLLRRIAWILLCGYALPAVALGLLYLVAIPILAVATLIGGFLCRRRWADHLPALVAAVISSAVVAGNLYTSIRDDGRVPDDIQYGVLFAGSVVAAVASATKLGRILGGAIDSQSRSRSASRFATRD